MNLNELAEYICVEDDKGRQLDIAQAKETIRILRDLMREEPLMLLRLLVRK